MRYRPYQDAGPAYSVDSNAANIARLAATHSLVPRANQRAQTADAADCVHLWTGPRTTRATVGR
eukprot:6467108-Pyramimonas_sp.AAC.1